MPRGKFAKAKIVGDKNKRRELKSDSRRRDTLRADIFPEPAVTPHFPRHTSRKRPNRREIERRKRDSTDIPGLDALVTEEARALKVGYGLLRYISAHDGSESELSSDDESLHSGSEHKSDESATFEEKKAVNADVDANVDANEANLDTDEAGSNRNEASPHEEEDFISLEGLSDDEDVIVNNNETGGLSARTIEPDPNAPWWPPNKEDGKDRYVSADENDEDKDESVDHELDFAHMTAAELIGEELLEYLRYVSPEPYEANRREATIKRLRRVVQQIWRSAKVSVFGSHATGMYLPGADIDVVIISDELRAKVRQEMHRLAARLKSNRLTDTVQVISHARVPIIKYVESGSNTNVDIAFGQTGGLETARLVSSWLQAYPVLKPMGMFVRQFLKQRNLSDVANGGLGGYAMICMMYSRLRYVISEFPSIFEASESHEENAVTVLRNGGLLLLDFFNYYGNEFDNTLMAVRCTERFTPFYKRTNGDMNTPQPAGLAIEDPQNRQNNISKASYNYPTVKRSFQNAADLLKSILLRRSKQSKTSSGGLPPESILGPLLKFKGNEPQRKKVRLDIALSVPDLSDTEITPDFHPAEPRPASAPRRERRAQLKDMSKHAPASQESSEKKAEKKATERKATERKATEKNVDSNSGEPQNGKSKSKDKAKSKSKSSKRNIDPWDSGSSTAKSRKTQDSSDSEPLESKETPSQRSRSNSDDAEDDSTDSRVKLTTAERRQFWKSKGGTPEQLKESKIESKIESPW